MTGDVKPRPTLRDERAAVTERRIAEAARVLFRRDGYAATTLAAVAREAGVAVQTVYAVHGSKRGLLDWLRQAAMDQPEATERYGAAMAASSADEALALFAASIRERWSRSADVVAIHAAAASADPAVRAGLEATLARRRDGIRALVDRHAGALREGIDPARAAAIADALTLPELYTELVGPMGWTADAYEAWLAAALVRELLPAR